MNIIVHTYGFFIFTCSHFLLPYNKSISFDLPIIIVLNIITIRYIILKYIIVFIKACFEKTKAKFFKSASNICATNKLMNWDRTTPNDRPTISDSKPIIRVSKNSIIDTFLLLIPSVR